MLMPLIFGPAAVAGSKGTEVGGKGKAGAGDKKGSAASKAGKADGKKDAGTKAGKAGGTPPLEPPNIKQLVMPEARTGNVGSALRCAAFADDCVWLGEPESSSNVD
jgi:hypothetical protein